MEGLYFQWVNTEKYQWNLFFYHASDLNYSTVLGSHFIFDYYFNSGPRGKYVFGAGFDYISINTNADVIQTLSLFEMQNHIYAPYVRAGRYFNFTSNPHRFSFLLWGGYEHDFLKGDLSFVIPIPAPHIPDILVEKTLDKDYDYMLLGAAFKATFFHFLEMQIKYHKKLDLNRDAMLDFFSVLTNVYVTRHWAVSYRYKYMEETIGTNQYHIGGIAYLF